MSPGVPGGGMGAEQFDQQIIDTKDTQEYAQLAVRSKMLRVEGYTASTLYV